MLQDMEHMQVSSIMNVKVGMLDQLEPTRFCVLTSNDVGLFIITVQHDTIDDGSFMYNPGNVWRQTPHDVLSGEVCCFDISH